MRLLSDPELGEEFDTIVDEITDEYLRKELPADERERVEKYFLSTTERQNKLEFAAELLRRAELQRDKKETRPSVLEQIAAFFRQPSLAPIATLAVVVIVAGLVFYQLRSTRSENYQTLALTISDANRADETERKSVKLAPNTGLKLPLTIPEGARGANNYAAQLVDGTNLQVEQLTEKTVTVIVPPGLLTPGSYAIKLSKVKPDNSQERISGSYFFAVE